MIRSADKEAGAFVADALTLAEPEGFIRTFLDQGAELVPFLHLAASQNITPHYARQLLAEFGQLAADSPALSTSQPLRPELVEPLSAHELEGLRLLAAGHTNHEIARAMIVSVNTVKSHLKNVYGKLGVNNRRAAAAQGRVLGLIRSDAT